MIYAYIHMPIGSLIVFPLSRERNFVRLRRDLREVHGSLRHDDEPAVAREHEVRRCSAQEEFAQQHSLGVPYLCSSALALSEITQLRCVAHLYAVCSPAVQISGCVDLCAVCDACVDVGEHAAVFERLRLGVNVESVSVGLVGGSPGSGVAGLASESAAHIVAGSV